MEEGAMEIHPIGIKEKVMFATLSDLVSHKPVIAYPKVSWPFHQPPFPVGRFLRSIRDILR